MAKLKLEIDELTDAELRDLGALHKTKMTGNANFPAPVPSAPDYDDAFDPYAEIVAGIAADEAALRSKYSAKNILRAAFATVLTSRGSHVQTVSGGDPAKIQSAGFSLQSEATPTTSLPQPQNLVASIGDNEGEIDLACNAVKRAKAYVWECREHVEGQPPGPWMACKISSGSKTTADGLVPGKRYAFRVRALGPNDVQSPWSDEAISMAA